MTSEDKTSASCDCCGCCASYEDCCPWRRKKEKERFAQVEYHVLTKSHVGEWPLGQGQPAKSFTMPQEQADLNYALLQRWGSQESLSRLPGKTVITQQPMGRDSRSSSSGAQASTHISTPSDYSQSDSERSPEIDFLLYYNISTQSLTVHLQRARHLPPKRHKNFVILLYLSPKTQTGDTLQSNVLQDTPDPIINKSIVFQDLKPDEVRDQTLVFQLYNGSTMGNLVGGVTLPLADADLYGMSCTLKIDLDREKIKAVNRGDLLLSLVYHQQTHTLKGIILKLANLKRQDVAIGLADVYIRIWLLNKGKRTKKWKSSVKQKVPTPVFNEPFEFDIKGESSDIHDVTLELIVMEQDRFSRDVTMGVVYIGMGVPHHTGQQHWEQVIAQPGSRISNWHPVLPVTPSL
jgi:hypothetical protein